MRKPSKRETVYIAVLGAVAIGYLFMGGGDAFIGGAGGVEAQAPFVGEAPVVELSRLDRAPDDYDAAGRNLFEYGQPPRRNVPPPPPPPPPVRTPPPERTPPPPRPVTPPAPVKPPKRQPPRPDFDYLGYIGPKENRIAVFEEKKKDEADDSMILARTGDVVHKDFRVVEFKYETVVLGYTDAEFKDQTTELQIKKK